MKMFIPALGTRIRLTSDWSFEINPANNYDFRKWGSGMVEDFWQTGRDHVVPVTIVAGTILGVERIYIRKTKGDYDSLTFRVYQSPDRTLASKKMGGDRTGTNFRFFASLDDVNQIEFDLDVPGASHS